MQAVNGLTLLLALLMWGLNCRGLLPTPSMDYEVCSINGAGWAENENLWASGDVKAQCGAWWVKNGDRGAVLERSLFYERRNDTRTGLGRLNRLRLQRLFSRMVREPERSINVLVFGGSMTAGKFVQGYAGAWPRTVEKTWNLHAEAEREKNNRSTLARLQVNNAAVSATSSQWLLERLAHYFPRASEIDLVILDYDNNDAASWAADTNETRISMQATTELIVRRILMTHQAPAIAWLNFVTSHRSGHNLKPYCREWRLQYQLGPRVKLPVMDFYGIATLSQQEAIWPDWKCPPGREYMDCTGPGCAHPATNGHQINADIVLNFLNVSVKAAATLLGEAIINSTAEESTLRDALWTEPFAVNETNALENSVCWRSMTWLDRDNAEHIISNYNTSRNSSSPFAVGNTTESPPILALADPCWTYKQDLGGKEKGLIAEGCFGASLIFSVRFGHHGVLVVNHLTTWNRTAGMTEVAISVPISGNSSEDPLKTAVFKTLGAINAYYYFEDDGGRHSVVTPTIFSGVDLIVKNAVQLVKITLVDSNIQPWIRMRGKEPVKEAHHLRLHPQKVKLVGLSAC